MTYLGAAVGPRASVLILRAAGEHLAVLAGQYDQHVSEENRAAARELRAALAQMSEASRQWVERRGRDGAEGFADESAKLSRPADQAASETVDVRYVADGLEQSLQWVRGLARTEGSGLVGTRDRPGSPWRFPKEHADSFIRARRAADGLEAADGDRGGADPHAA